MNKTGAPKGVFFGTVFYNPEETKPVFDWTNYAALAYFVLLATLGVLGSIVPRMTEAKSLPVKVLKSFSFYDNFAKIIDMSASA